METSAYSITPPNDNTPRATKALRELLLFSDGSVNPKRGIGYGAYLVVGDLTLPLEDHRKNVTVRKFESTASTQLELQTLLWALGEIEKPGGKLIVHTDSKNIIGLLGRRKRLENNRFRSKAGRPLTNHRLYRQFYEAMDQWDCEFVKVKGHKQSGQKNAIDDLFTLVDKASRKALRKST